ncbi:MAG: hypothetical protein JOZ96_11580 [Acidobacteria bacterium]|nr:hypothetical protein [Acidobacteriota bacterium]
MADTDFAKQKEAILGRFSKETQFTLDWYPEYVEDFPKALEKITHPIQWESCKFVAAAKHTIPKKFGVYCFSVDLGEPFPKKLHLPLYVGKASEQYLSERFDDYLKEQKNVKGREKIVFMLNKWQNRLTFWWAVIPKVYVDVVEQHLIMSCRPPCNTRVYSKEKFWGKAFD